HHPTAIQTTLTGLRAKVGQQRILAVLEARSNTMKRGVHQATLPAALAEADQVYIFQSEGAEDGMQQVAQALAGKAQIFADVSALKAELLQQVRCGDHLVLMSNGGFGGLPQQLATSLQQKEAEHV
ncbi:MAG: UDP-N-acetylmuramate:L-alanyl-gamma-D-glutamyl-meso-diaminopimelate ligase, partial [Alkalimonas sp.]|nr:UDP-N-acetylmuramate:L-alanyl-gamma-D-glutamyl-meso-diaminopimelate ligase [Alkalimonas sp.]